MKTRILLTTFGTAALAAITFNVNASNALLSPRAAGNQIKTAPAAVATHNPTTANQTATVSPRIKGNQTTTVAGVANDVNPTVKCARTMAGSPKATQACTANANMPDCPIAGQTGCMMR